MFAPFIDYLLLREQLRYIIMYKIGFKCQVIRNTTGVYNVPTVLCIEFRHVAFTLWIGKMCIPIE